MKLNYSLRHIYYVDGKKVTLFELFGRAIQVLRIGQNLQPHEFLYVQTLQC